MKKKKDKSKQRLIWYLIKKFVEAETTSSAGLFNLLGGILLLILTGACLIPNTLDYILKFFDTEYNGLVNIIVLILLVIILGVYFVNCSNKIFEMEKLRMSIKRNSK